MYCVWHSSQKASSERWFSQSRRFSAGSGSCSSTKLGTPARNRAGFPHTGGRRWLKQNIFRLWYLYFVHDRHNNATDGANNGSNSVSIQDNGGLGARALALWRHARAPPPVMTSQTRESDNCTTGVADYYAILYQLVYVSEPLPCNAEVYVTS